MWTTYDPADDILVLRLRDSPVAREASPAWNVHVALDADGRAVEIVVFDALRPEGALDVDNSTHG